MKRGVWLRVAGFWLLAVVLAGCGSSGPEVNVQATVDAAVAATAVAQTRLQATIDAAVAATQVARPAATSSDEAAVVETATLEAPPPAATTPVPADTPVPTALPTAARRTDTPAPAAPACQVVAAALNLRRGPGAVFDPPLRTLARGAALTPLSFVSRGFPSGQWIEVQVAGGPRGWVSAGAQFVSCNISLASLPAGSAPPTPTARPATATPTRVAVTLPPPPATPTRVPSLAVLPVDGGCSETPNIRNNRNVKGGCNIVLPGFDPSETGNPMVFRDRIVFQAEVFDTNVGWTDGAGIDSVKFKIFGPNSEDVHERTERTPGYCVFGGGEPDCTVWRFSEHNYQWPGGAALQRGSHSVEITIRPKSGDAVTWFWSFEIE